ncbi:MAG: NIPSNAP family containing protein [Actinobacteria bacterium]|nr:NIPSNAP family containing protein [Actinomycetota bacterium]
MNDRVYTHEFIDIIGPNRPQYMHHMTANWSPIGQDERDQLCFGVWGAVGTTTRWPRVVNMWEEKGFDGLAAAFGHELGRPSLQDEKLEKWWNEAANYRSGGFDRVLIPAPWTRTITELCADGVNGIAYAHETIGLEPGRADDFLAMVRDEAIDALGPFGWELVGALKTSMHNDAECILIWAIPTWEQWAEVEKAYGRDRALRAWRDRCWAGTSFERFLMCDAPLSPMRIGRQPARSDREPHWSE